MDNILNILIIFSILSVSIVGLIIMTISIVINKLNAYNNIMISKIKNESFADVDREEFKREIVQELLDVMNSNN